MTDNDVEERTISLDLNGLRLDVVLTQLFPDYSRSRLQTWIQNGHVLLDGEIPGKRQKVASGSVVRLTKPNERVIADCAPQDIPLNIVHEDEALIVINKPANLVMHPAAGNHDGTVQNALLFHYPELAQVPRAGIVHRLDKDTTGLFVVARTLKSHHSIVEQLQNRTMGRQYAAVLHGQMVAGGTVEASIGRHPRDRLKMAVVNSGKPAVSHYRIIAKMHGFTQVRVQLESGRTHQIRVHMAHIKHPLVGDALYGGRQRVPPGISEELRDTIRNFPRQALHAQQLRLVHPTTAEEVSWETELPSDMQTLIQDLGGGTVLKRGLGND